MAPSTNTRSRHRTVPTCPDTIRTITANLKEAIRVPANHKEAIPVPVNPREAIQEPATLQILRQEADTRHRRVDTRKPLEAADTHQRRAVQAIRAGTRPIRNSLRFQVCRG